MKKKLGFISIIMAIVFAVAGCGSKLAMGKYNDKDYLKLLDDSKVFDNTTDNALAQTKVAEIANAHLNSPVDEKGEKKVLLLTFDGARADSIFNMLPPKTKDYESSEISTQSGLAYLKSIGGVYLMYCGGVANDKETKQASSTAPGFATILTGLWGKDNGVVDNGIALKPEVKTILRQAAEKGKKVSFNARWGEHFDMTYKAEKDLAMANYQFRKADSDFETFENVSKAIKDDEDLIFGIFEFPDYNGHSFGFMNETNRYTKSVVDSDRYAYQLIKEAESRVGEDWLVLMTTDHGGTELSHGTQKMTDRMIFLGTNKSIK